MASGLADEGEADVAERRVHPVRIRRAKTAKSARPMARRPAVVALRLLLVATLVARLAKQLAVLLLRHALATLLDDGTHENLTKIGSAARAAAVGGNAPR
ncbi:hypothetical protein GCM10017608_00090 [Agromyces luteolus]|nr:hypothetical protein GCM10017608_00090 [Agromyces luteolus]